MYVRFPLSLRNVEDLLFERGIEICHETVRHWWNRFGSMFVADIRRFHAPSGLRVTKTVLELTVRRKTWSFLPVESDSSNRNGLRGAVPFGNTGDFSHDIAALYRRYRDSLSRYVTSQFGSGPPDPEDVVQVVFEKYAAIVNGSKVQNPKAFLYRSARNYVIDQRRRQAVRVDYEKNVQETVDKADDLDGERVLGAKQRLQAVEQAISQLDPRSREILIMSRIQGLSSAEIARQRGCSATLVKSIIAKALVACLQALGEGDQ